MQIVKERTKQVKVFVVDSEGKPCAPTRSARARRLLRDKKAKVIQVVPFTIQLNYSIENSVGSFVVGIDDGAKHVGVAIVNDKINEVVFKGQIDLRQDVKRLMKQRAMYRRTRRCRKLRHRARRFNNRTGCKIAPSIRCRKDSIIRFLKDMMKRVQIVKVIVEEVKFNHGKYRWGKWFSLVEQGKNYLKEKIQQLNLIYESTFGWVTKQARLNLGLSKKHSNDAIAICCNAFPIINTLEWIVKPKRSKIKENHNTRTCNERNGFKRWDLIKAENRIRGTVIGSVISLKVKQLAVRTKWSNDFVVSYKKSKLLQRFNGLVYSY